MERNIVEDERVFCGDIGDDLFVGIFVFFQIFDFFNAFQADFCVLRNCYEMHELLNRTIELPENELNGQHHTEGDFVINYRACSPVGNDDVLGFLQQEAACFLFLVQGHSFAA